MTEARIHGKESMPVGKVICLLRSYAAHAEEMGGKASVQPDFFLKPSTAIIQDGMMIYLPRESKEIHHEVELAVLIGRPGKSIIEAEADRHIAAYGILIDVTARDIQARAKMDGKPWSISKGFDTFAPISNFVPATEIPDPHKLDIWLKVNGETRQSSNTSKLLFSIPYIISWVSERMALEAGDIIATGTPEGVSEIKDGDTIEAGIDGLGTMTVKVTR